jgi:alkylation response protein AidB-like acyl-CoA dehydrogenase
MDFDYSREEEAFRQEFFEWLKENAPEGFDATGFMEIEGWEEKAREYRKFQKRMFDSGYAGISFPKAYGGAEGTIMQSIIVSELAGPVYLQAFGWCHVISLGLAAPTILAWGNEEQKSHFLPRTLSGEIIWCQGFSEPNAGSDLAGLSTKAVKDGTEYVINGQKIWSSFAHIADWCILIARTDSSVTKHRGLSFFLVDLTLPGVQINPIKNIAGDPEFNEIFFDDVRVPESRRVGMEGDGWKVALTTLGHERYLGEVAMASTFFKEYEALVAMAKEFRINGQPASKDPLIRQKLAQTFTELSVMRCNGYRSMSKIAKGESPGPEGSIGKLFWSGMHQRMMELAMDIQGPYHQLCPRTKYCVDNGVWQYHFLRSKGNTIEQGTSEIQKNIIGELVLGLPKAGSRSVKPTATGV